MDKKALKFCLFQLFQIKYINLSRKSKSHRSICKLGWWWCVEVLPPHHLFTPLGFSTPDPLVVCSVAVLQWQSRWWFQSLYLIPMRVDCSWATQIWPHDLWWFFSNRVLVLRDFLSKLWNKCDGDFCFRWRSAGSFVVIVGCSGRLFQRREFASFLPP
jgi:hypothetical protein